MRIEALASSDSDAIGKDWARRVLSSSRSSLVERRGNRSCDAGWSCQSNSSKGCKDSSPRKRYDALISIPWSLMKEEAILNSKCGRYCRGEGRERCLTNRQNKIMRRRKRSYRNHTSTHRQKWVHRMILEIPKCAANVQAHRVPNARYMLEMMFE